MLVCKNRGCEKSFDPKENTADSCLYHPAGPIFHEGMKGWSCCSKRVVDFNDFLKIEGCTRGMHSIIAAAVESNTKNTILKPTENRKEEEKKETCVSVLADSFQSGSLKEMDRVEKKRILEEELNDAEDYIPLITDVCKRKGCGLAYSPDISNECLFHNGDPVFHEGSKGWSCCPRKVLEFDEFLKIKGCRKGKHRFTDYALPKKIDCRLDWYQTQMTVTVNVYAKNVDKNATRINISDHHLSMFIQFTDGKYAEIDKNLFLLVKPSECSFKIMGTKIEIILKKSDGFSWPSLEKTDKITTWTTFGTTGGVGSVGAKEAIISADAPIHLLK